MNKRNPDENLKRNFTPDEMDRLVRFFEILIKINEREHIVPIPKGKKITKTDAKSVTKYFQETKSGTKTH